MNTLGVIVLAAATATGGIGKPQAWNRLFRPHAVRHGPPPASGPIMAPPAVDHGAQRAGFGLGARRRFPNTTSQLFFVEPTGMQIGWQAAGPQGNPIYREDQLTVPARYNFRQGYIYRLKLTNIAENPGLTLYPTVEVAPSTPETDAYLTHNPIPIQFTQEDFDQIQAGNFVTKVVYLPNPEYQELAISGLYGAETLVSTRLEPGVDPIQEADERGTILLIVRVGAIDLEMPGSGNGGATTIEFEAPATSGPGGDNVPPPPAGEAPPVAPVPPSPDVEAAPPEVPDLPGSANSGRSRLDSPPPAFPTGLPALGGSSVRPRR